jgi:hypothetical protein
MKIFFIIIISILSLSTNAQIESEKNLYWALSTGYLTGFAANSPSVQLEGGIELGQHLQLGLITGAENVWGGWHIPILVRSKLNLLKQKNTPFLDTKLGYLASLRKPKTGGAFTWGGSLGYHYGLFKKVGLEASVGYRLEYATNEDGLFMSCANFNQINRFDLRFAITFK